MWPLFKPKKNIAPPWHKERVEELQHNRIAIAEQQRLDKATLRERLPKLRNIENEITQPSENGQPTTPQPLRFAVPHPPQAQIDAKREWEVSNTHQAWKTLIEHDLICTKTKGISTYNSLKKAHLAMERARRAMERAQQFTELGTKEQLGQILGIDFLKAAGIKPSPSLPPPAAMRQIPDFGKHKAALLKREIELRQNDAPEALSFVAALLQVASGIYTKADLPDNVHAAIPQEEDLHRAEATQILHLARKAIPDAGDEHARRKFMVDYVNQEYGQQLAVTILQAPTGKSQKYVSCDQLSPDGCQKGVALLMDGARFHVMTGLKPTTNPKLTRELYLKQKTGFGRFESFITDYLPSQRGTARRQAQTTSNEMLAQKFASGVMPPETDINEIEAYKEWDKRTNPYRLTKNLQPAQKVSIENKFLFIDPEALKSLYLATMLKTTPTRRPKAGEQLAQALSFRRLITSTHYPGCGASYEDRKIFFDNLHDDKSINDTLYKDLTAINDSTQSLHRHQEATAAFNPSNWLPPVPAADQLASGAELADIVDAMKSLEAEMSALAISLPPEIWEERMEQFHSLQTAYARGIREGDLQRICDAYNHLQSFTPANTRLGQGASSTTPATNADTLACHLRAIIRRGDQSAGTNMNRLSDALINLGLAKDDVDAVIRFNLETLQAQLNALRSRQSLPATVRDTPKNAVSSQSTDRSHRDRLLTRPRSDRARQAALVDELLHALHDIVGLAQGNQTVEIARNNDATGRQNFPGLLRDALVERIERNMVVIRAGVQDAAGKVVLDKGSSSQTGGIRN